MPKYLNFKVAGYWLYFTSKCIVECMHVHASDQKMSSDIAAKFFVKENGDTILQKRGILKDKEISIIQKCIKANYKAMYELWAQMSPNGFYKGE